MDKRIHECPGLKEQDIAFLRKIEAGMAITADVSRADMLLCCLLAPDRALIVRHTMPKSTASLYRNDASGRVFTPEEQPLLFRTFRSGSGGHGQKEVLTNGAPVIQDCYAISRDAQQVIAALVFETNMVAQALKKHTGCTKINTAAIGNIVRQLHVHVVARNEGDPGWPGTVWGYGARECYRREDLHQIIDGFRTAL